MMQKRVRCFATVAVLTLAIRSIGQAIPATVCDASHQYTVVKFNDQQLQEFGSTDGSSGTSDRLEFRLAGNAVFSISANHRAIDAAAGQNHGHSSANQSRLAGLLQNQASFKVYDQGCVDSLIARLEANEKALNALQDSILNTLKSLPAEIVHSEAMQQFKKQILSEAADASKSEDRKIQ